MSITINITADNATIATRELLTLAYAITGARTSAAPAPAAPAPTDITSIAAMDKQAGEAIVRIGEIVGAQGSAEPTAETQVAPEPAKKTRAKKEVAKVTPAAETADTKAQDAADEAEESAAAQTEEYTLDSVRDALGKYVKKFGLEVTQIDGPAVIKLMFGEGKGKVSDIPDDQASLKKAVDGIEEMTLKNPFKRTEVKAA